MDDRHDNLINGIEDEVIAKARFRKGLAVRFKHANKYLYGIINDITCNEDYQVEYIVKTTINNTDAFIPVKERWLMPHGAMTAYTSQDEQKPAYFPF